MKTRDFVAYCILVHDLAFYKSARRSCWWRQNLRAVVCFGRGLGLRVFDEGQKAGAFRVGRFSTQDVNGEKVGQLVAPEAG